MWPISLEEKKYKFLTGPLAPRVPTTIPGTRAGTGSGARGRSEHVASCARVNTGGKRGGRLGGAALPNASILFLEKARPTHMTLIEKQPLIQLKIWI